MNWKSSKNGFLWVRNGVELTPVIDNAIYELDAWVREDGRTLWVSSGKRSDEHQLGIIISKAKLHGIEKEFPQILTATVDNIDGWLLAWGRVLQTGDMVNPPRPARAPFDYIRSDGTARKAGILIPQSGHQLGLDFDIAQEMNKLSDITAILDKALADKMIMDLVGYLVEPVNHAVHVDCKQTKIDKF